MNFIPARSIGLLSVIAASVLAGQPIITGLRVLKGPPDENFYAWGIVYTNYIAFAANKDICWTAQLDVVCDSTDACQIWWGWYYYNSTYNKFVYQRIGTNQFPRVGTNTFTFPIVPRTISLFRIAQP